jgi:sensor domain CHASE-containing protein
MVGNRPMFIGSMAIRRNDASGTPRGAFLLGLYLDQGAIKNLEEQTQLSLALYPFNLAAPADV